MNRGFEELEQIFEDKPIDLKEFWRTPCKVKVGDRIYRKIPGMTIPDRMEVTEVTPNDTGYIIKIRYMDHVGGTLERLFSDVIFKDDSWVIEKKGVDF